MISNANPAVVLPEIKNSMTAELYGLSTDTKPVADVPNGSVFFEEDTGKVFIFNCEGEVWHEITG